MFDNLRLYVALISLLIGVLLLYDGFVNPDASQTARVVVGAAFVSVGLISAWFGARSWLEFKRYFKNQR